MAHSQAAVRAPSKVTPGALVSGYGGIICDLDGVVYHGDRAVPGAPEALQRMAARGIAVVYATNNASRLPQDVAGTLTGLGAPATPESVVTSAQAGAARVRSLVPPGASVVALGGPGVVAALKAAGLVPIAPGDAVADAVLQGYGPALTVEDFTQAARHLRDGAIWVATNADATLPQSWGIAPGNGAYVDILRAVAGRDPVVVGKPEPPLYELATERLGARLDGRPALAVGDRLDTDIDGAAAAGLDAAWVLTGVHLPSDLLARPTTAPPRYVIGGLAELELPYAVVRAGADGWACGDRHARVDAGAERLLILDGTDSPTIEAVRAGLAALVEARDAGNIPLTVLVHAAKQLDTIASDLLDDSDNDSGNDSGNDIVIAGR